MSLENAVLIGAPLITGLCTLVGACTGAAAGQWFADKFERQRANRRNLALLGALRCEVDHCAEIAGSYLDNGYESPAYRLHYRIYDGTLAQLATGPLDATEVEALIRFYSHVDQVNWGLEEVDRLRKESQIAGDAIDQLYRREIRRLQVKAADMRSPGGKFYVPVAAMLSTSHAALRTLVAGHEG